MNPTHQCVAIVPCQDLQASARFYALLGFKIVSDYGRYLILEGEHGEPLHLNHVEGWPPRLEDNPFGLYLYREDVDAAADKVRALIIEDHDPSEKPWGTYEFSLSDPSGLLVRVGRRL